MDLVLDLIRGPDLSMQDGAIEVFEAIERDKDSGYKKSKMPQDIEKVLFDALKDEHGLVPLRVAALRIFRERPEVFEIAKNALSEELNVQVRGAAALIIAEVPGDAKDFKVGPQAVLLHRILLETIKSPNPNQRKMAINRIFGLDLRKATFDSKMMSAALNDEDASVRIRAIEKLSGSAIDSKLHQIDSGLIQRMRDCFNDRNPEVRLAAAKAWLSYENEIGFFINEAKKLFTDPNAEIHEAAAKALERFTVFKKTHCAHGQKSELADQLSNFLYQ